MQGTSALHACCQCGGGTHAVPGQAASAAQLGTASSFVELSTCKDIETWRDKDGYACKDYVDVCENSRPRHASTEFEKFSVDGVSA